MNKFLWLLRRELWESRVVWMAPAICGGKWVEPVSKKQPAAARTGEQIVKMRCSKCHETGKGGAPKIGDQQAWIPRLKDGLDATVRSAINGHGGMPARAGMPDLTDAELKDAITYMINKGHGPVPAI